MIQFKGYVVFVVKVVYMWGSMVLYMGYLRVGGMFVCVWVFSVLGGVCV